MLRYRSSVTIDRPAALVFSYLVDPARQALWSDVPMRQETPGALAEGSRMEVRFGKGPLVARLGLEIVRLEPDGILGFRSFSGPIGWEGEYRLAPAAGGGTTIEQEGQLVFTRWWRLLEPVVGAEIRQGEVRELERLKEVVEGAPR